MTQNELLLRAGAVFGAIIALILLRRVVGLVLRFLLRTAVGGGILAAIQPLSGLLGITLGVNLYNAMVIGALGAPGFGLLLLLNWLLTTT